MTKRFFIASLFLALLSAVPLVAQNLNDPAVTNVTYPGPGGATLKGYLVNAVAVGKKPAVLLIHEYWGLTRNIRLIADALRAEGYTVLAPDLYRGKTGRTPDEAAKLMTGTPREQVGGDLDAALAFLRSRPNVDPARVVSWGFCFGGAQSMYLGTRAASLAGVVIFYGPGPLSKPEQLGELGRSGPVLGIYGAVDPNIPVAQVDAFDRLLKDRGIAHTITEYPGMGHAFMKADNYQKGGAPQQAWEQTLAFLKAVTAKPSAPKP